MCAAISAITMFATLLWLTPAKAQKTDWTWIKSWESLNTSYREATTDLDGRVMVLTSEGVFRGDLFGTGELALTPAQYSLVQDRTQMLCIPDGPVLVMGNALSQTTFGFFRFETISDVPTKLGVQELDGQSFATGVNSGDVQILGNGTIKAGAAFTFNGGQSWRRMQNDDVVGQQNFAERIGDSVYVLSIDPPQWYVVDAASRMYTKSSLDPAYCRYALLPSGAGMAIKHIDGDEVNISIRSSAEAPWQQVPTLATTDGAAIQPERTVYLNSDRLFATQTGKAIFFLDSARMIVYDGVTATIRSLTPTLLRGEIVHEVQRVRGNNVLRLSYRVTTEGMPDSYVTIEYSLETEQVKVYETGNVMIVDVNDRGYLSSAAFFSRWDSPIARPVLSALDDLGNPIGQVFVDQVGVSGGLPFLTDVQGNLYAIDNEETLPGVMPGRVLYLLQNTLSKRLLRRVSVLGLGDSSVAIPGSVRVNISRLGVQPVRVPGVVSLQGYMTCVARQTDGRFFMGGDVLARQRDTVWEIIPIPSAIRDSRATISSMAVQGNDTLVVAFRGYAEGSEIENNFSYKKGGVAISTDAGVTWNSLALPSNEQWVESLTLGPDRAWYCWATDMVFDTTLRGKADPYVRNGTATLYRSVKPSGPWIKIFTDDADPSTRREAFVFQWPISFSPRGRIATCTPRAVFVAENHEAPFQEVLDLPITERFGGVAFGDDEELWIGGSYGVHKRMIGTTNVGEQLPELNRNGALVAWPNPATDKVEFRLQITDAALLPNHVLLISADGTTTVKVPRINNTFSISTGSLASGLYFATALIGSQVATARIVVVR